MNIETNTFSALQISGKNEKDQDILSVLVKKTYRIDKYGNCIGDIPSLPLIQELTYYNDSKKQLLKEDFDIYPFKTKTDVVIKGFAQSNGEQKQFISEVLIGNYHTSFLVIGNRKTFLTKNGKITFSEPQVIDKVPLRYDFAYGGWDKIGEYKLEVHSQERIKQFEGVIEWQKGSAYRYPRNPAGKGYLVDLNKEAVEQLELPNLEDIKDRLLPSKLAAGNPTRWTSMPIPRCTDWLNLTWFPRSVYFGFPLVKTKENPNLTEILREWTTNDVLTEMSPQKRFNFRSLNGASLGLQWSFLLGDEKCRLVNIHPQKTVFDFSLPGQIPEIWVDGRNGTLKSTIPVLHTILIEPEENRLSLVWRGCVKAIRPYLEHELLKMPFKVKFN